MKKPCLKTDVISRARVLIDEELDALTIATASADKKAMKNAIESLNSLNGLIQLLTTSTVENQESLQSTR